MAFTKKQIAEKINRPVRTITYWTDAGLVHPDDDQEPKAGRARKYSERNLLEFAMVNFMANRGIDLKTIKYIMDQVQPDKGTKDFFGDPKWGQGKELVYMEWHDAEYQYTQINFIAGSVSDDVFQFDSMNTENPKIMARIIWIGQVKQQALKLLKK